MCDLGLEQRCKWGLHSSGALRSVDVSEQPIGPIFRDQAVLRLLHCSEITVGT